MIMIMIMMMMMMMMMMMEMDERPQPENMSAEFPGEVGPCASSRTLRTDVGFNRSGTRAETKNIVHPLNGDNHEMNDRNSHKLHLAHLTNFPPSGDSFQIIVNC